MSPQPPRRSSRANSSRQQASGRGAPHRNAGRRNGRNTETPDTGAGPKTWGGVARKGAYGLGETQRASSREAERIERPRDEAFETWVPEKKKKTGRSEPQDRPRFKLPEDAISEITTRAGKRSERLLRYLRDAGSAYAAERWGDAKRSLRPLLEETPDAPVVQELHGMVLYRTGKWAAAVKELEAAHLATRSFDLYPAIMDCNRALRRFAKTEALWDELRAESPAAEVTSEGRIVMAGALADQDRLADAIRLMEKAPRPKNNPKEHHLRSWYVLADLWERAGEASKARNLFQKIMNVDPELADVVDRLESLD